MRGRMATNNEIDGASLLVATSALQSKTLKDLASLDVFNIYMI